MARSRTSRSTMRWSSLPSRSWTRSFSRVRCVCSRCAATSPSGVPGAGGGGGGSSRSSTRSSAACSARSATSSSFSSRIMSMEVSTRSRTTDSTSRPTYPTSVYFEASTLTNGHPASRASRRAISVFPTPVGPIIKMFFGKASSAISGGSLWRRTRLRRATATARLAAFCPTMYLSSSSTISRGVMSSRAGRSSCPSTGSAPLPPGAYTNSFSDLLVICSVPLMLEISLMCSNAPPLELFDCKVGIGENANLAGDAHGLHRQILRCEFRVLQQRARRGQSIRAARSDSHQSVVWLNHIASPGKNERALGIGYDQQRFQMAKRAVLAPLLGQLNRGFLQIARKLLQLPLEALKKGDRVGRRARETGHDFVVVKTPRLPRRMLHHVITHGHLAIGDQHHFVFLPHAQHRSAVHLWAFLAIPHPVIIARHDSERQKCTRPVD